MHEEVFSDAMAVIPLIHNGMGHRRRVRHLRKHGLKGRALMALPCRQHYRDAGAFIVTAGMDFGGQAAARAAQSLCGVAAVFF